MALAYPVAQLMGESDKAKRWRARAERLRSIADGADDPVAKRSLLRLARDWEHMAERSEQAKHPSASRTPPRDPPPRPGKKG